jgi:membrane protein
LHKLLQFVLDVAGFLAFVFRRWTEDRCLTIAGSLTFTTVLSLVPLFTVVVALLSSTPFFDPVMSQIRIFLLTNLVPEIADKIINVYMVQFAKNAGRLTTVSLGALFVTTLSMLYTIDGSLNAIWRVRRSRSLWLSAIAYVVVVVIGPLFIGVGMSVTSYLLTLSMTVSELSPHTESLVLRAVPVTLGSIAFFVLYRVIPNRHVSAWHAALGGIFAASLFETMKTLFATYVRLVPTYNLVYGTFAAIPIVLLFIYFSWLVVLLGAELTACAVYWRHGLWRRADTPGVRFREALQIGRHLAEARGPLSLKQLRADVAVPSDELEDTLARLEELGIVRREGKAYALAKAPGEVTLGELYHVASRSNDALPPDDWSDYSAELDEASKAMQAAFNRPLASLARSGDSPPAATAKHSGR